MDGASANRRCCTAPQLEDALNRFRAGGNLAGGTQDVTAAGSKASYTGLRNVTGMLKKRPNTESLQQVGWNAVGNALRERKRAALDVFIRMSTHAQAQVLLLIRESIKKSACNDPDMPAWFEKQVCNSIDSVWEDVAIFMQQVVEDEEQELFGDGLMDPDSDYKFLKGVGGEPDERPRPCLGRWWRAKILYSFIPFDKSIFGQAKDILFWIMMGLSVITKWGCRIIFSGLILLLIVLGCPPDEYQLVSLILQVKVSQFLSSGLFNGLMAAAKYYACVEPNGTHSCNSDGPASGQDLATGVIDFLGNCALVWASFMLLPYSETAAGTRMEVLQQVKDQLEAHQEEGVQGRDCVSCLHSDGFDKTRGGRIRGLLAYDLVCFVLAVFLFIGLAVWKQADPGQVEGIVVVQQSSAQRIREKFGTEFFFARIFYGLLSAPFLIFCLPVLNGLLTHTKATGYNLYGICVPYMLRPKEKEKKKGWSAVSPAACMSPTAARK